MKQSWPVEPHGESGLLVARVVAIFGCLFFPLKARRLPLTWRTQHTQTRAHKNVNKYTTHRNKSLKVISSSRRFSKQCCVSLIQSLKWSLISSLFLSSFLSPSLSLLLFSTLFMAFTVSFFFLFNMANAPASTDLRDNHQSFKKVNANWVRTVESGRT